MSLAFTLDIILTVLSHIPSNVSEMASGFLRFTKLWIKTPLVISRLDINQIIITSGTRHISEIFVNNLLAVVIFINDIIQYPHIKLVNFFKTITSGGFSGSISSLMHIATVIEKLPMVYNQTQSLFNTVWLNAITGYSSKTFFIQIFKLKYRWLLLSRLFYVCLFCLIYSTYSLVRDNQDATLENYTTGLRYTLSAALSAFCTISLSIVAYPIWPTTRSGIIDKSTCVELISSVIVEDVLKHNKCHLSPQTYIWLQRLLSATPLVYLLPSFESMLRNTPMSAYRDLKIYDQCLNIRCVISNIYFQHSWLNLIRPLVVDAMEKSSIGVTMIVDGLYGERLLYEMYKSVATNLSEDAVQMLCSESEKGFIRTLQASSVYAKNVGDLWARYQLLDNNSKLLFMFLHDAQLCQHILRELPAATIADYLYEYVYIHMSSDKIINISQEWCMNWLAYYIPNLLESFEKYFISPSAPMLHNNIHRAYRDAPVMLYAKDDVHDAFLLDALKRPVNSATRLSFENLRAKVNFLFYNKSVLSVLPLGLIENNGIGYIYMSPVVKGTLDQYCQKPEEISKRIPSDFARFFDYIATGNGLRCEMISISNELALHGMARRMIYLANLNDLNILYKYLMWRYMSNPIRLLAFIDPERHTPKDLNVYLEIFC